MAHGGRRQNAGRKKGAAHTKTRAIADKAASEGITPLEYMLERLRDENEDRAVRADMAKAAAPYVHPRLAAIEHSSDPTKPVLHRVEQVIVDSPHPRS